MKKRGRLMLVLVLLLTACDTTSSVDNPMPFPSEEPGLMTFHAYYPELNEHHIALTPFDDPTAYRFISRGETAACSRFSRDQSKVLFNDIDVQIGRRILLYDVEKDTTIHLAAIEQERLAGAHLCDLTWNDEGTGFFYWRRYGVNGQTTIHYYGLGDSAAVLVHPDARLVEDLGRDTLIVEVFVEEAGDRHPAYFFMDIDAGTLSRMRNSHLDFDVPPRLDFSWDDERRLFVISVTGEQTPGAPKRRARLVLTNLDGSFFRELTSVGPYRDITPRWGPGGTVFFTRIAETVRDDRECGSVMIVDTETGEVREYLRPEAVEGAPHLCYPDY